MSLWTPDGEHQVPRRPADAGDDAGEATGEGPAAADGDARAAAASLGVDFDSLSDDQRQEITEMAAEIAEARQRIAETPAAVVVANHAMGLYELAAIHLGADEGKLPEARLAIDAMAALLDATQGRLGENEAVLHQALQQVQLAFVQRSRQPEAGDEPAPAAEAGEATGDADAGDTDAGGEVDAAAEEE